MGLEASTSSLPATSPASSGRPPGPPALITKEDLRRAILHVSRSSAHRRDLAKGATPDAVADDEQAEHRIGEVGVLVVVAALTNPAARPVACEVPWDAPEAPRERRCARRQDRRREVTTIRDAQPRARAVALRFRRLALVIQVVEHVMLPPGPTLPSAAQMLAWLYRPTRFFDRCLARYGEVFTMRLPGQPPRVMLARQDTIRAVFTGSPARLHAGGANALVEPLVGPRSVLLLDDAAHLRQRRLLLAQFAGRKVAEHGRVMHELTVEAIDRWPVGAEFPVQPELQALTLRVILATIFGVRGGERSAALFHLLSALLEQARSPLLLVPALQRELGPLTPWSRFVALKRRLDAALRPIFAERRRALERADGAPSDILGQLVAARDDEGRPLSDAQLRDELVTLLVAGHETTANALAFTLFEALADAAARERLRGELAAVVGAGPIGHEHLDRLPYLDATIHEGLRLHPVLGHVGRVLTEPMRLGGYDLPAGWMAVPCIYLAHRDPAVFPEPERFRPDRFLERTFSPYAYLPFGGGARRCIGMSFALQEMKIVLATILARAGLSLRPGYRPGITRRGVVWAPAGGVPVRRER